MDNMVEKSGTSVLFLLFIIFLILKLTGTITWSWWYVTMPLWISFAFGLGVFAIVGAILFIGSLIFCGYGIGAYLTYKCKNKND